MISEQPPTETINTQLTRNQYPAYKDSGVDWLGAIPEHWKVGRIKHTCKINRHSLPESTAKSFRIEYVDIGSVTLEEGIVQTEEFEFKNAPSRARRLAKEGDVVISTVRTYLKAIAFIGDRQSKFIYSTGFAVLNPLPIVKPKFLAMAVKSDSFTEQVSANSKGMSYPAINSTELGCLAICLPPLSEQTRIAEFLDRKTAHIDQAIAQKERLIELLNERRQVMIQQAVTRGLKPNVPMKDSGIDWIGEIPAHWEVSRLKYVTEVQSGITLGKVYSEKGSVTVPYLRVANVQDGFTNTDEMAEITIPAHTVSNFLLKKDDILVTEGGDIDKLGRGALWHDQIKPCIHQNHVFAVRTTSKSVYPQFIALLLNCDYGKKYFTTTANKTTNLASTNKTKLGNFPIVIMSLDEQASIQEAVSSISSLINDSVDRIVNQIKKLQELKSTLINSAVTGKIKI